MLRFLISTDLLASRMRPAWMWLGQLGVVVLGIHLAADRLDDYLGNLLSASEVPWSEPQIPLTVGTWGAIGLELAVVSWAVWTLLHARATPVKEPRAWWGRRSVHSLLAAAAWLPISLAGAWVVGMAVEDVVAGWLPSLAAGAGIVAALIVTWRLTLTGWLRVLLRTPEPKRALDGIGWVLPVLTVALLALRHGLPIWGWL